MTRQSYQYIAVFSMANVHAHDYLSTISIIDVDVAIYE
jgi:hypothetical protein